MARVGHFDYSFGHRVDGREDSQGFHSLPRPARQGVERGDRLCARRHDGRGLSQLRGVSYQDGPTVHQSNAPVIGGGAGLSSLAEG